MATSRYLRILLTSALFALTAVSSTAATAIPGKIEAEAYAAMAGVQLENCSEGTQDVGWIDTGDWMAYAITVSTAGSYTIQYRVASPNSNAVLSADYNAGANQLGTVAVPNTGGWQNWTTISQTVTLPAGSYNLGVFAQVGGFNLNWINIVANGSSSAGPAGYTWCAGENGSYTFSQTVDVAYGANGTFVYKTGVSGTIAFNNATFGDPIVGVAKAGYYKVSGIAGPAGYTWCASENGSYTFNQTVDVAYGANGAFVYKSGVSGTITFNNATFGDPAYGVAKAGFYKAASSSTGMRILVPAYFYPTSADWSSVVAQSASMQGRIWMIANPNSGPGSGVDANYTTGINNMHSAGGHVLGYVATGYGTKSSATVQNEIASWYSWYPSIDGIFLDEQANTSGVESLYQSYYNFVKGEKSTALIVGNPGTSTLESYLFYNGNRVTDVLCLFEDSTPFGSWTPPSWCSRYGKENFYVLQIACSASSWQSTTDHAASENMGWIYSTDRTLSSNPWGGISSYFPSQCSYINSNF